MPTEILEENQKVAQIRLTCDCCGKYIGTRILLKSEVETRTKTSIICTDCESKEKQSNVIINVDQPEILRTV
jgi:hypothetical protein